jgi:hypothetical protein
MDKALGKPAVRSEMYLARRWIHCYFIWRMSSWTRNDKLVAAGLGVAMLSLIGTFVVPEVRRELSLETPTAIQAPIPSRTPAPIITPRITPTPARTPAPIVTRITPMPTPVPTALPSLSPVSSSVPTPEARYDFRLAGLECDETLASGTQTVTTVIQFHNNNGAPRRIYWMDFWGKRQYFTTLQPGRVWEQATFAGHMWLVSDESGNCVVEFMGAHQHGFALIQK